MPVATLDQVGTNAADPIEPAPVHDSRDPFAALWAELAEYHAQMRGFAELEPDEVMLAVSAISARVSEIRAHLARSQNRAAAGFRAQIVEPLLTDLDFQFRIHSRVTAIREMDLRLAGGQP